MADLSSVSELAGALGDVVGSEDPIAELRRRGFNITGDLEQALGRTKPSNKLSVAKRRRFAKLAGKGKVTFRIGAPPARRLRQLAPDDYDVIAGIRLSLADKILNGLRETQTIPQLIPLERLLTSEERRVIAAILAGAFQAIPRDSQVGNMTIRTGISTAALDGTDTVLLRVPFSLDIFHLVTEGEVTRRVSVGPLLGRLSVVTRLSADVHNLPNPRAAAVSISITLPDPSEHGSVQLEVDVASPLQPTSIAELTGLASILQGVLGQFMGPSFTVSPFINLPSVPGVRLVVQQIDVRSVAEFEGDLIMLGVRFLNEWAAVADKTRLSGIRPNVGRNVVLRVHERYLNAVLEKARVDGILDRIAQEQHENASIESTNVQFSAGQIVIHLSGVVVDLCGPLDIGFTVVQTFRFFPSGNAVGVESFRDISVSTGDVLLCVLMASIVALLVSLASPVVGAFLGVLGGLLILEGLLDLPLDSDSVNLLSLNSPIPRTELLPVLNQLDIRVDDGELIASAACTFKPDNINTFIYVRILNNPVIENQGATHTPTRRIAVQSARIIPLADALVQVCDQDAPAPVGDDVVPPEETHFEHFGPKFITSESVTYDPPQSDQILDQGTTDFDGRVMFTLAPFAGSSAGFSVTESSRELVGSHEIESTVTTDPVLEKAPDIYFLISSRSANADTRKTPGGLTLNLRSKRLGTPAAPLTFTLPI